MPERITKKAWRSPDEPPEDDELILVCYQDFFSNKPIIEVGFYKPERECYVGGHGDNLPKNSMRIYGWAPVPPKIGRRVKGNA